MPTIPPPQDQDHASRLRRRRTSVMLIAMGVAPLMGWLLDIRFGIAVLAVDLALVTWLLNQAAGELDPATAARCRLASWLTGALALLTVALLIIGLTVG